MGLACAAQAENRLQNISTRGDVQTGDGVLIGGFIIDGSAPKTVLIRARGPSLADAGVPGTLADPMVSLFRVTGEFLESNDSWMLHARASEIPGGLAPTNTTEAAIIATLDPGAYTPIVAGADGGTGVGIVEVFEVDTQARLQNISTRGFVGTGDNVMIGGFIIAGDTPKTVVIRGRGPSLADAGVSGALMDPTLTLTQLDGTLVDSNNNHSDHATAGSLPAHFVPTNTNESVIMTTLDPGAYTAILAGTVNTTGIGIVEVFEVAEPAPDPTAQSFFDQNLASPVILGDCHICHNPVGIAAATPLLYTQESGHAATNFETIRSYVAADTSRVTTILQKARGENHSGGLRFTTEQLAYLDLATFLDLLVDEINASDSAASLFSSNIASQVILGDCQGCHNPTGTAASTALIYTTSLGHEAANYETIRAWVAADTSRATTLLQKARGEGHGGSARFATDDQRYIDLSDFIDKLLEELGASNSPTGEFWDGVALASPAETLRRAALIVARRVPTDDEMAMLGGGSEAELRDAVRALMNGDGFHEFLIEGANDRLHTDAFINGLFMEVGDLNVAEILPLGANLYYSYPDNDVGRDDRYMWVRQWQFGMTRAPTELIAHVVENDLPYTEILTADYTMVNPAMAYVMRSQTDLDPAFNPVFESNSPLEFRPGRHHGQVLPDDQLISEFEQGRGTQVSSHGDFIDYPHAGVLNTGAYLNRYPTTETNRNRARARWTFFHFLGLDIEASAARTTDPVALADTNNPTMNNPSCTVCHAVMDPLAGAFQNYGDEGFYRNSDGGLDALPGTYKHPEYFDDDAEPSDYVEGDTWFRDMRAPGLDDQVAPDADRSLAWVAQQIVDDPRFATAAVKFWWPALMGDSLLANPEVSTDVDFAARLAAFEEQNAFIGELGTGFTDGIDGGGAFNMRDLLTEMMMSRWFRGRGDGSSPGLSVEVIGAGGRRLLTPSELDRKTAALTGWRWGESENMYELDGVWTTLVDQFSTYYGGVDHNGILSRARGLTSLMANVAERHAINMACPAVVIDFEREDAERHLFDGITPAVTPLVEFSHSFNIAADVLDPAEMFTLGGDLAAGTTSLVIYFVNDWYDENADPRDRNVLLDHLVVRDEGGSVILDLPMQDLPDHPGVDIECGGVQWNPFTQEVDMFNLWSSCEILVPVTVPAAGSYDFELTARAEQAGPDQPIIELRVEATDALAGTSQGAIAIKSKLAELHDRLLGEQLPPDNPEIEASYQLLVETWIARRDSEYRDLAWHWESELCYIPEAYEDDGANRRWEDPTSMLNAWSSVMIYLMSDYKYLHE